LEQQKVKVPPQVEQLVLVEEQENLGELLQVEAQPQVVQLLLVLVLLLALLLLTLQLLVLVQQQAEALLQVVLLRLELIEALQLLIPPVLHL